LLVLSQKFELAPSSVSISFSDSDTVTWIYIPAKENNTPEEPSQERTDDSQPSPNPKTLDREKSTLSAPPISLSKLFIDEADWSMGPDMFDEPQDDNIDDVELNNNIELSIPAPTTIAPPPPPVLFRGLSIESMYSMWTQSTSMIEEINSDDDYDDEERPKKRTKTTQDNTQEPLKGK
jgi:hypothetical protein